MLIDMAGWNSEVRAGVKRRKISRDLTVTNLNLFFLNWITADNLPFKLIRSPFFRAFLEFINSNANRMLFRFDITIRRYLAFVVRRRRSNIQKTLRITLSKIHLIFDV